MREFTKMMQIFPTLRRYKWWLMLAVLILLNVIRYWPVRHAARNFAGGPLPMGADRFPQPDAAMQARIDAMPEAQRTAFEERMRQDRDFFASVQKLPDAERQQKVQEHFAQNPPPPGMPPGGPGDGPPPGGPGGGPGGPGDGGAPHIPPPDVRRGMDQQMVNSMKNAGGR